MSPLEEKIAEPDSTRRTIFIIAGIVALAIAAGIIYLVTRPEPPASAVGSNEPQLEGAIRAGSAEFEQYRERIVLDPPEADESSRVIGDIVMVLFTTVRNFTGRTIVGLEVRGSVVDLEGKPVKERTVLIVPNQQPELEPNKTMEARIKIEGFSQEDLRANIKMEVIGVKFKQ
jgi:hypothetical protein